MGKKNKKEKKGKGAEKTAMKTEKNAEKKIKKKLQEAGEDDIEGLIAEFQEQDRKRLQTVEEKCPPPSPRSSMTIIPHPDKEELIMFGGEYFNGTQTFMYNDLFFYNIKHNEWTLLKAPNAPPPRCAHQAVVVRQGGGQLWIFGGEFASPTQSQFYHYKDLWVFHLREKKWEEVKVPGAPSSRSGHRIATCRKQIIIFGGFHDNIRDYKYYNDVHIFNLETYSWTKLEISGTLPCPRSACQMVVLPDQNGILVYGGYSKTRVKKEVDKGIVHCDMFTLTPADKDKENMAPVKWKWTQVRQTGMRPSARSGFTLVSVPGNRAVFFGGVYDEEEDEEDVKGIFYSDLYSLEVDKGKWHELYLKGKKESKDKKRRRKKKDGDEGEEDMEVEETEVESTESDMENLSLSQQQQQTASQETDDGVFKVTMGPQTETEESIFKVTIGPQSGATSSNSEGASACAHSQDVFMPCARMNALMTVKNNTLFLYGGLYEIGDRQVTLSDMYSLDLQKLDEWKTLIENNEDLQEWEDSESSSDEDEEDDEEMEEDGDNAEGMEGIPAVQKEESVTDYFGRTRDFWLQLADEEAEKTGEELTGKMLKKRAFSLAEEHFKQQ